MTPFEQVRSLSQRIAKLETKMDRRGLDDDPEYLERLDGLYAMREALYDGISLTTAGQLELGRGRFGV